MQCKILKKFRFSFSAPQEDGRKSKAALRWFVRRFFRPRPGKRIGLRYAKNTPFRTLLNCIPLFCFCIASKHDLGYKSPHLPRINALLGIELSHGKQQGIIGDRQVFDLPHAAAEIGYIGGGQRINASVRHIDQRKTAIRRIYSYGRKALE